MYHMINQSSDWGLQPKVFLRRLEGKLVDRRLIRLWFGKSSMIHFEVQPGCIVRDEPGIIGLNIRHLHPGDPAGEDQAPTCVYIPHPEGSFHLFLQQSATGSGYLVRFLSWASSIRYSQGTASSSNTDSSCYSINQMIDNSYCSFFHRVHWRSISALILINISKM